MMGFVMKLILQLNCVVLAEKFKECNGSPVQISRFIYPSFCEYGWVSLLCSGLVKS